ncbi:hypothetical protein CC1G_15754 [Coprinopsis cinerea okayama7|uniref:Uncharacterized protein n=1 Tax=Coprinopsis cinerea (strain Okayama-7 / 130 / ATCC MYA-4618 / FGSC 9003) TaxID=240176 RepID=D6RR13_COPC7|nr:hypothetical protein CC1G_15754 [Coprinopsis cinerea okayama7\|eukprot:XP_002910035.1 hypothetical protein CC1G_15754 [Coprinopsis cinerea okayama7\
MHLDEVDGTLIPPINRLPTEVLGSIFLATLPARKKPTISTTEVPLLLTDVCNHWRAVARATSQLWSEIEFYLSDRGLPWNTKYTPDARGIVEEKVRAFTRWMDYAGPTSLFFGLWFEHEVLDDVFLPMLYSVFSPRNVAKIRTLETACISERMERYVYGIPPESLHSLTKLVMTWDNIYGVAEMQDGEDRAHYHHSDRDRLFAAPSLTSIDLNCWSAFPSHPTLLDLPVRNWANITELRIRASGPVLAKTVCDVEQLVSVLEKCASSLRTPHPGTFLYTRRSGL